MVLFEAVRMNQASQFRALPAEVDLPDCPSWIGMLIIVVFEAFYGL